MQSRRLTDPALAAAADLPAIPLDAAGPAQIALVPVPRLLLTPTEAAAALRISPRLLWSKTKLGEIPCVRISKAVRYSPSALQAWIDGATSDR